jgi:hypothetical protein
MTQKAIVCPCALNEGKDISVNPSPKLRYIHMGRKYFTGNGIRWLIENERGQNVSCGWCGNIANAVITGEFLGMAYQIPICKKHIAENL